MSKRDFVPYNDALFDAWQSNLITTVPDSLSKWDIPASSYDALLPPQANWAERYAVTKNPDNRTHAQVLAKNEARKPFESALRGFIKAYLTSNPKVADGDREVLGLPVHKTGRTPARVATDAPDFDIDTSTPGCIKIIFFKKGSNHKRGKPDGQRAAEIRWLVGDTPPARWEDLTQFDVNTHSPAILQFENDRRGKTLYLALRWENTRGEKGPWSEIRSAIIP